MNPVPSSPDPERRPTAEQASGRRRSTDAPALSVGTLDDVRPGSLLVALPGLTDPTFTGSVVYVLDHSDTGTIGVVLGRPSEVRIGDVLPGWSELAVAPEVFHVGGPVEADTALCLATRRGSSPLPADSGLRQVSGAVHLVDLDSDPDALDGEIGGLRVFAGYAGWSNGQLAAELAEGAWACVTGLPGDVLTGAAGPELWRSVLRRQSGRLGVLSTAPADPSAN
ncbi:YqgE/AlgH family protein [Modestobacter sp. SSW1-42]|uniref:YqgE/AlgH family protein n=1 Tax=Modestobacter sp. SSW1-42 TaxID=596372 RepID=UPI0039878FFF